MKLKKDNDFESMFVTTFAFKKISNKIEKQFELLFKQIENYKNDFVTFINNRIEKIKEEDEELKDIQNKIDELHNTEGKVSKEEEKSDELKQLYRKKASIIGKYFYEKEGKLNRYQLMKDFNQVASLEYNIYLHDDAKSFAKQNVIASLEKWIKGEGKYIHTHKYGTTTAIQSRRNIDDNGNTRSTMIQFVFENEKMYARMWDLNPEYIKEQKDRLAKGEKIQQHKWIEIRVNINKKDVYQQQIFSSPRYGNAKLTKIWKNGKWLYRLQISLKDYSPVVKEYNNQNYKVAIDCGIETNAVVRSDGYMYIEEISPDTPRFAMEKVILQQNIDNNLRKQNPHRYKENGIPYSKKEVIELNLKPYTFSNHLKKKKGQIKTICAKNARKRAKNNEKSTKIIFELGNEFYIEKNNFKAWKMKRCRMNKKAKEIYDNGIRKNDYTKEAQDRATAQIPARLKSLCEQKKLPYNVIEGLALSTYNHFTQKNDVFLSLKDRIVTLDKNCENKELGIVPFNETFTTIEYNGKKYILQRDLYAASKMLFCYVKKEKKTYVNKQGEEKEKIVDVWYFNQNGYEKFFDNIFYPAQEEYLKVLQKQLQDGVKLSGTIFG